MFGCTSPIHWTLICPNTAIFFALVTEIFFCLFSQSAVTNNAIVQAIAVFPFFL